VTEPLRCLAHDPPDASGLTAWSCPEDCPDFLDEIDRRIADVDNHGNFIRTTVGGGVFYRQTFRNHQPVGEPTSWRPVGKEQADGQTPQM
jgi:hypothetical protein